MLEVNIVVTNTEGLLAISVSLKNTGKEKIIVAARAPYGLKDTNQLYISNTEKEGYVHFLLGNPIIPFHLSVYQPLSAFYRFLESGEKVIENFSFLLPLIESSPYEKDLPDNFQPINRVKISHFLFSIDWGEATSVGKKIPVEGKEGLWEIWYSDKQQLEIQTEAPSGIELILREKEFTRF